MLRNALLAAFVSLSPQAALALDDLLRSDFITSNIAVLCGNPFNLTEGEKAFIAQDLAWMKSVDCVPIKKDLKVIRISPSTSIASEPWQVRLFLPDGKGVTLWGHHFAFTLPDGRKAPTQ